jgi:hypothetical protein
MPLFFLPWRCSVTAGEGNIRYLIMLQTEKKEKFKKDPRPLADKLVQQVANLLGEYNDLIATPRKSGESDVMKPPPSRFTMQIR